MARNFSELAILEGNENCIPIRLNGIVIDVPKHYFNTNLYNVKEVLDHEDQNHLNGIAEHFEREGLMIGDDGFVYASLDPDDQTLSGDDYEPIGLLQGEDLELAGFKFKMPKFKMPGKKKSGKGQLVKTRSGTLKSAGNLATKGFRTFNPIGMMGKQGLIGRNLKNLKNPFKGFKIGNPFKKLKFGKGGKGGGSGMMDAFTQMQEMQAQQNEIPEEEIVEEEVEENTKYIGENPSGESEYSEDSQSSSDYSEDGASNDSQSDYSEDSQAPTDYSEDASIEESQSDAQEIGASSDLAFSAVNTALSFVPGGSIASGLLSQGKGIYDQQQNQRSANKQAVSQQRIALLQNLIKKNPKKKVVVKKKPAPPQLVKPTQVKQNFSTQSPTVRNNTSPTDFQPTTEPKKDNSMMIGLGIAALAVGAIAMSGSGKD